MPKDRYWKDKNWTREGDGPGLIRPPSRRLGAVVSIKLTGDEFSAFYAKARSEGYSLMTDYLYDLVMEKARELTPGLPHTSRKHRSPKTKNEFEPPDSGLLRIPRTGE
jgi:hypothetical protein